MKVDVYDTYATSPTGHVFRFELNVPAGTSALMAERFAHAFVGGSDPEIETACILRSRSVCDEEVIRALKSHGYSVQPWRDVGNRAA